MQRRARIALIATVTCVLLAGCSGGGGPSGPTPENPQTTVETPSKTLPDPLYRFELRGRNDSPVEVSIELSSVDNETTYYEKQFVLNPEALRDYSSRVEDRERFRATVSVANDSVTRVVGPDEGYSVWVQGRSAIDVHHLESDGTSGESSG